MQAEMGFEMEESAEANLEKITEYIQLLESLNWLKRRDGVEDRKKPGAEGWSSIVDRKPSGQVCQKIGVGWSGGFRDMGFLIPGHEEWLVKVTRKR